MPHTILVADDSATIRKAIAIAFEKEPYEVINVNNGADAVTQARSLQPALVLADHLMPGKTGYEVAEALRVDPATAHIPVLMLSGTAAPFDENRCRTSGAIGHIPKPFDCHSIIDKVNEVVRASAQRGAGAQPSTAAVSALQSPQPTSAVQPPAAPGSLPRPPQAQEQFRAVNHQVQGSVASASPPGVMDRSTVIRSVPAELLQQQPEAAAPQATPQPVSTSSLADSSWPTVPAAAPAAAAPVTPSQMPAPGLPTPQTAAPRAAPGQPHISDTVVESVPADLLVSADLSSTPSPEPTPIATPMVAATSTSEAPDLDLDMDFDRFLADVDDSLIDEVAADVPDLQPQITQPVTQPLPVQPPSVQVESVQPPATEAQIPLPSISAEITATVSMPDPQPAPSVPATRENTMNLAPAAMQQEAATAVVEPAVADRIDAGAEAVTQLIANQATPSSSISTQELEAQAREVIERVVWEVVPTLAETLIREEIARLLAAKDS
jgi:CheY-like chemotaxis protein